MINKIKNNKVLILFIIPLFSIAFFSYCANPAAPQGGPKDTIPPKVISITPQMFTLNFNAERVTMIFDEYIVLQNAQTEIMISPEMKRRPKFTVKGKQLLIDFEEKLDSATTYKIDFGLSIKDNNENNPLGNFSYVFSTGDEIDSLAMSGQVVDAFTGDSILNALILLYDAKKDTFSSDSLLFVSTPNSIARTDSTGVFIATNLKPIDYRVYAISEESSDGKYNSGSDKVAFVDSMLNPSKMNSFDVWYNPARKRIEATPQILYRLFSEPAPLKRQNMQNSSRRDKNIVVLEFAEKFPQIDTLVLDSVNIDDVFISYTTHKDTMTLYYPYIENMPDTLKGMVRYLTTTSDSLARDTLVEKKFELAYSEPKKKKKDKEKEEEEAKNPFSYSFKADSPFNPEKHISLDFIYPIISIDSSKITLTKKIVAESEQQERGARGARGAQDKKSDENPEESSEQESEIVPITISRDTTSILRWNITTNWEDGGEYTLTIPDSVIVNNLLQSNDSISQTIKVMAQENFGTVNLNLTQRNPESNYIVMLEKDNSLAYQKRFTEGDRVTFKYVAPGMYSIKVIEDKNKNGKWDEGVLTERILPEKIAIYKQLNGGSIFEIKENWELDNIELDMHRLFKNPF